jgi:uncharacterized membrane protein
MAGTEVGVRVPGVAVTRRRWDPIGPAARVWYTVLVWSVSWTGMVNAGQGWGWTEDELVWLVGEISAASSLLVYLVLTLVYFRRRPVDRIRARAAAFARRRAWPVRVVRRWRVLAVLVIAYTAVHAAAFILPNADHLDQRSPGLLSALAAADVFLTWFVLQGAYAEYYAVRYYADGGGLDFNGDPEPDYLDFAYFAFSIGMTFGTTDVGVTSKRFRRIMLPHKLLSFAFNTAILALVLTILFQ